jgi:hemerythrin-like metal-binding protein
MSIYFEWTKDMSVGEDHIDNQHQKLLLQINEIIHAMTFGATSKEVSEAIHFFDGYVNDHFSYEEEYMRKYNYPEFDEHRGRHKEFILNNLSFKKKLNSGVSPRELILDIETYIGQWWLKHIGQEDKKYHDFIDGISK